MANLINPTFNMPDIVGNMREGQQYGRQLGIQQRQDADRSQLRNLSAGILAGDSDAFMQAAAIDPDAAMKMQGAGDNQLRRLEGGLDLVDRAYATGNKVAVDAAYQQVRPFLQRFTGTEGPEQWDESMRPGMEQLRAKIAMAKSGQFGTGPAGYQEFNLMTQGLTPEDRIKAQRINLGLDGRAASGGYGFFEFEGADGVKRMGRNNPRTGAREIYDESTGQFTPLGGGSPSSQVYEDGSPVVTQPSIGANGGQVVIGEDIPPQVRAAILAGGADGVPNNGHMRMNNPVTSTVVTGRRAEDEEAAKVSARLAAENANFQNELDQTRQLEAVKGQASVDQAIQTERGKAQVEKEQAAPGAISTMEQAITSIDELLASEDLGSIVGWGSVNPLNRLPNSPARGLIARAEQISGQAFLAAFNQLKGAGAITEKEGAAATAAMARLDRSQSLEDYQTALRDLRAAIAPALERQRAALARGGSPTGSPQAQQQPAAAAVQRARNPQTGQMLELRNGQWVPAQ